MEKIKKQGWEIPESLKIDFAIFIVQGMLVQDSPGQRNFWISNFFATREMIELADIFGERFHIHRNDLLH